MKKRFLWMLAAILISGTTVTMLTSCSANEDNPVSTYDPASVVGKWYVEAHQHSIIGEGEDNVWENEIFVVGKEVVCIAHYQDAGLLDGFYQLLS